jgi:hypothetical protein
MKVILPSVAGKSYRWMFYFTRRHSGTAAQRHGENLKIIAFDWLRQQTSNLKQQTSNSLSAITLNPSLNRLKNRETAGIFLTLQA